MIEKHVNWFVDEVQKHREKNESADHDVLRKPITRILEAFIFRNLRLQNPRTYSLDFTENFVAIELGSMHQTRCALSALVALINEGEYLTLPYSTEPRSTLYYSRIERDVRESYEVFEELFQKYPGQRDAIITDLNRYAYFFSLEGLNERLEKFDGKVEKEIEYLEGLLNQVLTWDEFPLYFGNEAEVMKSRVQTLLAAKFAKQEIIVARREIEKDHDSENAFPEIFTQNGYILFDSLVKSMTKKGRGFQAEVGHFFRLMEYDGYANKGDTRFLDWFAGNYPELPEVKRMRLLAEFVGPSHSARERRYYEVKHQMKLK